MTNLVKKLISGIFIDFFLGLRLLFHILRFFKQFDSRHVSSLFRHFQVIILRLVRGLYRGEVLETFVFLDLTKI